jgi:translation initiation factor 2B subunit (eIF-2B alpha/beta/delta family)
MSSEQVGPSWRRELETEVERICQWLGQNRQMGAGTLARAAAGELIKLVQRTEAEPWDDVVGPLSAAAERLRWARPSMVAPVNLLGDATRAIEQADQARTAIDQIRRLTTQSEEAETQVSSQAAARITPGSTLMTISYSSTVLRTLLAASSQVSRVYVCEGRPLMEGRQLAERLHAEGLFAVTLLTDAQAFLKMPHIDTVLLGADAILPDRSAVNKVGSAQLALAAHRCGKQVWVVAERLKFVRVGTPMPIALESQPAAEVWSEAPDGLDILNVYFEIVPADLIDEVMSEERNG